MKITDILTKSEVLDVLGAIKPKRNINARQNLIIFRLSGCCGLRRMEVCALQLDDLHLAGERPHIIVRKEITKGRDGERRDHIAPLWWDKGTLRDLTEWKAFRIEEQGALPTARVVCRQDKGHVGQPIKTLKCIGLRWQTALRSALEQERVKELHMHCGRHSFCSHSIQTGHNLVAVRDAVGHANIRTTSGYLHYVEADAIPDLFGEEE